MARKKSEFLGALGIALQIFKAVTDAVLDLGGGDDDLRSIIAKGSTLPAEIAALIMSSRYVAIVDFEEWESMVLYVAAEQGISREFGRVHWLANIDAEKGVKLVMHGDGLTEVYVDVYYDSYLSDDERFRIKVFRTKCDAERWAAELVSNHCLSI